jgi:hypothetical protein
MAGFNLPPGCSVNDIPGNRPEDDERVIIFTPHAQLLDRWKSKPELVVEVYWKAEHEIPGFPLDHSPDCGCEHPDCPGVFLKEISIDRPNVGGWIFGTTPSQVSLANRLVKAINAGAVYCDAKLMTDVNGKTYVSANTTEFFHKRHMNVSLKKVGF